MTTITLKINEKTKAGKLLTAIIEFLSKEDTDIKIISSSSKSGVEESLEDIKKGNLNSYKNSSELFKKVLDV